MSPDAVHRHGAITPTPAAQSKDLQSGKTKMGMYHHWHPFPKYSDYL